MIWPAAGKILFGVTGSALIFVGTAFLGFAIFTLLQPSLNVAGAAGVTAASLLLAPAGWAVRKYFSPPPPRPAVSPQTAALTALAGLAREKPLLAALGAGLLGLAELLLRRR